MIGVLTLLPFVYVFAGSFATEAEITRRAFFLWPEQFSLGAYEYIFSTPAFIRGAGHHGAGHRWWARWCS